MQGNIWILVVDYERLKTLVGTARLQCIVSGHVMQVFTRYCNWLDC